MDAGAHWVKLTEGIPTVDKGRIALAVSPQKPDVVYATITTNSGNKQTGWYRSEDAGGHWVKLNDFVVQDPEYYGEILRRPFPVRPGVRDGHGGARDARTAARRLPRPVGGCTATITR